MVNYKLHVRHGFHFFQDSLTMDEKKYKIKYNYNVKMKSFPSLRYKETEMCGTYL